MDLDRSLLKEFAKVVNDVGDKPEPKQYVHGTVTTGAGNTKCVMLDGSDMLTPISEVVNAEAGDRVLVSVSNHQATVIGNITFPPSARKEQQAIDSANGALEQSSQAIEKANDAQAKANSAITDSSVASALANEAKTESAKAQEDANTAIQNADEAKQLAQASSNKSDETQQLANQVKDSVNAANKDISKLKAEVKTANDNIAIANTILDAQAGEIATIKETYSTKVETENAKADLTTEISKKVGELKTSVENNFSTKTENVALEQKLQTQITQNANSISSTVTKVEKLESDTTEQQKNIDKALQDAQNANTAAGVAKSEAEKAKTAADTAKKAADDATAKAESATTAANLAEQKVTAADKQLQQAKTDLAEAQENLNNVTSRVDATEQEIADAKQKVETANANVTKALTDVAEAKNNASKANEVALRAQSEATDANNAASDAQTKAANAQQVATNAQQAANKAQSDLAALTNRVTTAETNITQTNEAITAQASKITETNNKIDGIQNNITNNYYSKEQTDAQIKVSADNISQTVSETYETKTSVTSKVNTAKQEAINSSSNDATNKVNSAKNELNTKIDGIQVGGRNLLRNTAFNTFKYWTSINAKLEIVDSWCEVTINDFWSGIVQNFKPEKGVEYIVSYEAYLVDTEATSASLECDFGMPDNRLDITKKPTKYTKKIPYPTDLSSNINFQLNLNEVGKKWRIRNIKLEKGNKATDWTSAPEDQEQYVDDKIAASEKIIETQYQSYVDQKSQSIEQRVEKIKKETDSTSTRISSLETNFKVSSEGLEATKKSVDTLTTLANGAVDKITMEKYIRWNGDNLELGKSNQPFKCKLSTEELAFYQDDNKVAWISNQELNVLRAIIAESIGCGDFRFVDEGDLGFSLK